MPFLASLILYSNILQSKQDSESGLLVLRRGTHLNGGRPYFDGDDVRQGYWDCSEAEIDAAAPTLPIATMFALTGGVNRNVLIRFGLDDFGLADPSKPCEATLVFTLVESDKSNLKSIRLLKRPWMTPPVNVVGKRIRPLKEGEPVPFSPGVSWTKAGGDIASWEKPGALGTNDSELLNVDITKEGNKIVVKNLGSVVTKMLKQPGSNFGWMLEFSGETGIWNSLSPEDRPELRLKGVVQRKVAAGTSAPIYAVQEPNGVSFGSPSAIDKMKVRQGVEWLYEGPPKAFSFGKSKSKDPRSNLLHFTLQQGTTEHQVTIDPTGQWAQVDIQDAAWWRSAVDASVFSFAPFGAMKYVNPISKTYAKGLGNIDMLNQEIWEPKTDISLLLGIVPPPRPLPNPLLDQLARPVVGPLPMSTVDGLLNGAPKLPTVVIVKVVNLEGVVIPGAKITVETRGATTGKYETEADAKGYAILPAFVEKLPFAISFKGAANGADDTLLVQSWYLTNLYARGNTKATSFELPLNLPLLPIQRDTNLATGKPTKDSKGSFPAQLVALNDGKNATVFKLEPEAWVEIDLGRDRLLGELSWEGSANLSFDVQVYGTSQKIEEAEEWFSFKAPSEGIGDTRTFPTPVTARYIRIRNLSKSTIDLAEVKVFAAKRS